jgi:hypothetical protein
VKAQQDPCAALSRPPGAETGVLGAEGLRARRGRLAEHSAGLAKEVVIIGKGNDPLLYLERKAYLGAVQDALAGVEGARVTLAKALQRIGREPRTVA